MRRPPPFLVGLLGSGLVLAAIEGVRRLTGGGIAYAAAPPPGPDQAAKAPPRAPSDAGKGIPAPPAPQGIDTSPTGVYRTPILQAVPSPDGGFVSFRGMRVCALPFIDARTGLFARLSFDDAVKVGHNNGARLLTYEEFEAIARYSRFIIKPCNQPVYDLATSARMRSFEYATKHDECVRAELAAIGFDGSEPCANVGKQFLSPNGANHGWWVEDGKTPGSGTANRAILQPIQKRGEAHIKSASDRSSYTDYSQLATFVKL